jgi:hypothetical protein
MKLPVEVLAKNVTDAEDMILVLGLPHQHDVDATLELRLRVGPAVEPELWGLKKGDKLNLIIEPEGGWPPLEKENKGAEA